MEKRAPDEQKLLDHIDEYGWHVLQVQGDETGPGFCYSVGLNKTFGAPELVVIGLPLDVGHEIINIIGDDIASGKKYEAGRYYSDIIEGYDCYLMAVSKTYYKAYFGYGIWYYKNEDFPVLQCIYPDKDNVFPWDWSEEERFVQPILGNHDNT